MRHFNRLPHIATLCPGPHHIAQMLPENSGLSHPEALLLVGQAFHRVWTCTAAESNTTPKKTLHSRTLTLAPGGGGSMAM